MDTSAGPEHAYFPTEAGSFRNRLSCSERSAFEAAPSLTMRAALLVILLLSLGLWTAIWLLVSSLTSA